eukprot:scaffold119102_cov33-Phaeocystis_antarctica.AAC.1
MPEAINLVPNIGLLLELVEDQAAAIVSSAIVSSAIVSSAIVTSSAVEDQAATILTILATRTRPPPRHRCSYAPSLFSTCCPATTRPRCVPRR